MIRVQENTIQIIRYKIKSTAFDTEMYMEASTLEEAESLAEQFNGEIETLDTSTIEWIDGITIPETNKSMEAALEILNMGEEGYKDFLLKQEKMKAENLLAENESLKQQLLETQLALTELFESTLVG